MPDAAGPARIAFDLDRDIQQKLNELVPWGIRAHVFRQLIMMLIDGMEKGGHVFLAALLSDELKFSVADPTNARSLNGSSDDEG
jgi:hypothetical protein